MEENAIQATTSTVMPLFGASHLVPIGLLILFVGLLVFLKKSSLQQSSLDRLGQVIALILFINFPLYFALQVMDGSLTWATAIPLYPCPLSSLLAPILVRTKNPKLFNVIFYWVFAGTVQAVITPEIKFTFPHYEYFYFWICHAGLLALLGYMLIIQASEPKLGGLLPAFAWFNVLMASAAVINALVDTNYYYLKAKPMVPTLIDYLGPWPWYIVSVELVAFTQFFLSFAVFWFVKNKVMGRRGSIATDG